MTTARTLLLMAVAASLTLAASARAQSSLFSGRVVDEATSLPIAGAMVQLPQRERRVRTDSTGLFYAGPLEPGPVVVMVRAVGYMPVTTSFRLVPRDSLVAQFQLRSSLTTLAAVTAEARRPTGLPWMYDARLRDFEDRRKVGLGRFLDWRVFEDNKLRDIPEILQQHIPGIHIVAEGGLATSRSSHRLSGPYRCFVQIVVNEVPQKLPFNLRDIRAADVIGFEYYTVASTPARFGITGGVTGGSHCGTAVIWTKY